MATTPGEWAAAPDADNPGFFYSTGPHSSGNCTITNYDRLNQTISGTFYFTAEGFNNGAELAGVHVIFSGSFDNIPIGDLSDPRGPCYSTIGSDLGSGATGTGGSSSTTSTITFRNNAHTPIQIEFNGDGRSVSPGEHGIVFRSAELLRYGHGMHLVSDYFGNTGWFESYLAAQLYVSR